MIKSLNQKSADVLLLAFLENSLNNRGTSRRDELTILPVNLEISSQNNIYQNLFSGGKGLRGQLSREVADCLNIQKAQKDTLSRVVEYIHQASLLHDDVIDGSPVRRGTLSGWRQHSMKKAVLAGDYLLAEAAEETARLKNFSVMTLTAQTLKKLIKGEWLQTEIKEQESKENLEKVQELKTASLFQWSLKAPFLLKGLKEKSLQDKLNNIGRLMGLIFQRADDLLDFDIRNKESKVVFKDLEEGTFNSFAMQILENNNFKIGGFTDSTQIEPENDHSKDRQALKACRSLKEVKKLIGKKAFENTLKEFDGRSQQKVVDCQNEIEQLGTLLTDISKNPLSFTNPVERFQSLKTTLKKWPEKLYWRK